MAQCAFFDFPLLPALASASIPRRHGAEAQDLTNPAWALAPRAVEKKKKKKKKKPALIQNTQQPHK
eukprot:NODE_15620_length_1040_cov_5.728368.p4 GENE.NODE_15620_length_1040_cov_5.728368~~NODE_15620_length_1040_cov_5.728368.p4  ORF type:complete len:66 (+),score=21.09 NODE_15620_length_1040_cov_5.728368:804-1001(+)